jgi:hypothetical protein
MKNKLKFTNESRGISEKAQHLCDRVYDIYETIKCEKNVLRESRDFAFYNVGFYHPPSVITAVLEMLTKYIVKKSARGR